MTDWEHFRRYMSRAAGRVPVYMLVTMSFGLSLASANELSPDATAETLQALELFTVAGWTVHFFGVLLIGATAWVVIPALQALEAFPKVREVMSR